MASEPELEIIDDGLVCWVCQFVDCDEHPEEPLLSTGCACCRPGSSGGRAHVSCLVGAAAHQEDLWSICPTCKQQFTGAALIRLSRARWELYRSRPEADAHRLIALSNHAGAILDSCEDDATARSLLEEAVAVQRRTRGINHLHTLEDIGRLGRLLARMDEDTEALPLLEEAVAGLRLVMGDGHAHTLGAMRHLAAVHIKLGATAKGRLLFEEVVLGLRRTEPVAPNTLWAIANLGAATQNVGDCMAGQALQEEAATSALRELGPDHPCTQHVTGRWAAVRQQMTKQPSGARASGRLVGLASKPELNGKQVAVVGFDTGKGRYHVRHLEILQTGNPIGIKSASLIFKQGSAVIVEGLDAAPEWNGKRGLVESYDAAKGRYRLLVKGRKNTLGVKVACCKLEFAVEQQEREHEATRRARVEANVRAALAARELEAEAESTG
jgi:hypothetical protein